MNLELRNQLARVARELRALRLWRGLAICWLIWSVVGGAMLLIARSSVESPPLGWIDIGVLALLSAGLTAFAAWSTARDERIVARHIEVRHPELGTLLLAAIEQTASPEKETGYLQRNVVRQAIEHGQKHNWLADERPRLRKMQFLQFATLAVLVAVCAGLANEARALTSGLAQSGKAAAPREYKLAVDPGDCEVERGTPLVVIAQFSVHVPADASLNIVSRAGSQTLEMTRCLDDPKFVARIPTVEDDLTYRVAYDEHLSDTFHAKVFDYPALVRADARLEFPSYAGTPPKSVENVRHISALEGTQLTLDLRLNKPVAVARLVDALKRGVPLTVDPQDATIYHANWKLIESRRLKLELTDYEQRSSRLPEEIAVTVTPNRPPQITLKKPARDVEVSPLEELQVQWKASDDYGIVRSGISFMFGDGKPQELETFATPPTALVTAQDTAGKPNVAAKGQDYTHLIPLESLAAKPDDLLSYFVWVEDIGPDGKPRRTSSDMYFAEVRPFEQIYRQGEQPSAGQQRERQQQQQQGQAGGAAQQAEELAEMQKQIINATWKLVRRESAASPTAAFGSDVRLVKESQQAAINKANQTLQSLEDAESRGHLQSSLSHMNHVQSELSTAEQKSGATPLQTALSASQVAYQDLLKMRAREFQVVRGQQQQQQRGQSANRNSRSQRQLNQLDLKNDENRYETQSRAQAPQQDQAAGAARETLNKLRDLARRQEDLNDRLHELQSALEQANSPQEQEELTRELKRLREQQQEILRDTDEMIAQEEQSNNSPQSQANRQKMEEGRAQVERTSKALEQNDLPKAVSSGARAGEKLNQLREVFRQQSANQFANDLTEMRRQARELDTRQQQISHQLNNENASGNRSLRPTGDQTEAQTGLQQQQQDLKNLLDRMHETIDAADEPEPLLARQLYDTAREANQKRLDDTMDIARRLMDAGVRQEAGRAVKSADEGVSNLRRGVERAAESVLGDETESLRRAQSEVNKLSQELNRELPERAGASPPLSLNDNNQSGNSRPNSANAETPAGAASENSNQNPRLRDGEIADRDPFRGASQRNGDEEVVVPGYGIKRNNRSNDSLQKGSGDRPQQGTKRPGEWGGQGKNEGRPGEGGENERGRGEPGEGQRGEGEGSRQRGTLRGNNDDSNRGGEEDDLRQLVERNLQPGGNSENERGSPNGPITGGSFRDWSDRLRDVEDMLDDPNLRGEAARIRDRAAEARREFKKHAAEPDWAKLKVTLTEPLNELSRQIENEIRKHESPDALVPVDRDPVPPEFTEQVRRYYERLGSGE